MTSGGSTGRAVEFLAMSSGVFPFPERGQGRGLSHLKPGDWLSASREPSNAFDPNALLLCDRSHEDLGYLGYVDSEVAAALAPRVKRGWVAFFLVSTAYMRQSGAWTVNVMVFSFPPQDFETVKPVLDEISNRVAEDRFDCRYHVAQEKKGSGPYGLGFSLARQDVPASHGEST